MTEASRWRIPRACSVYIGACALQRPLPCSSPSAPQFSSYTCIRNMHTHQPYQLAGSGGRTCKITFSFPPHPTEPPPVGPSLHGPVPISILLQRGVTTCGLGWCGRWCAPQTAFPKKIRSDPRSCRCMLNLAAHRQLGRRPKRASSAHGTSWTSARPMYSCRHPHPHPERTTPSRWCLPHRR